MYNLVSDNSSGNIPPPPQATFIFLMVVSCVVELWNDSSQIFLIQSLASPCVDELYMFVAFITVSDNICQLACYIIIIIFRV